MAESDDLATPDVATADFSCYRRRKTEYSDAELAEITANLQERAQRGDVFAYFKHEEEPTGAVWAAKVLAAVRGQRVTAAMRVRDRRSRPSGGRSSFPAAGSAADICRHWPGTTCRGNSFCLSRNRCWSKSKAPSQDTARARCCAIVTGSRNKCGASA